MIKNRVLNFVSVMLISTLSVFSQGFWTETQNNSFRTGRTETVGNLISPQILWKYFRGGNINPENIAVDKKGNIFYSINGVLKAVDDNLNLLWESDNFGSSRIFRIIDLDKDGINELVVAGNIGIRIVSSENGSILSVIPTESPDFAKFADLNEDGFDEIIVRGKWNVKELRAYNFLEGASAPVLIWKITSSIESYGFEVVTGNLDNIAGKEIILDRMPGGLISVFRSYDGLLLRDRSRVLEGKYAYGYNQIINVDSDEQNEFIFSGNRSSESDEGSYSITVYDYVNDSVQWQYEYGFSGVNKGFRMIPDSVGDFNGDGVKDIAVSVYNNVLEGLTDKDGVISPDIWTTLIYRADNGLLQERIDNQYLEGIADLNGDGIDEIILRYAPDSSKKLREYSEISAYSFSDGELKKLWSKERVKILKGFSEDSEDVGAVYVTDAASIIRVGDAYGILVIEDINGDGSGDRIFSISGINISPSVKDAGSLFEGESLRYVFSTESRLYFSGNDGFIHIFDRGLALINEKKIPTGNFNSDSIFINSGKGGKLLTQLSTNSYVHLDSCNATLLESPEILWNRINQFYQPLFSFDSNGDGQHEFISLVTNNQGFTDLFLHNSNGGLLWKWTIGKSVTNPSNFITGDFDGDKLKDIAFTFTSEEEGAMFYALSGLDGSVIGSHSPQTDIVGYYNNTSTLIGDIDLDGIDDIFLGHAFTAEIISGNQIDRIVKFEAFSWPNNSVSYDFAGDKSIQIFANQRTGAQKQVFDTGGISKWKLDTSQAESSLYQYSTPYPGIAKIDGDEGFDIVLGGKFGDISAYSGVDGSVLWRKCLNYGTVADISVSVIPTSTLCSGTTLSNIVTGDIDGNGKDDFVVGDKFGNLYVVDVNGGLLWTMKFNGAIGNPVLADVNDDGKIEILVGAGDGFLYAIGQRVFVPAPQIVRDVAVVEGEIVSTSDIDEMINGDSYGGFWKGVDSALRYEVKLTDHSGTVLREAVVTGANQIVFEGLELNIGDTLYLNVRTINSGGYDSDWARSNGVTVVDKEITPDDDIMPDEDVVSDHDIAVDSDTGSDAEQDEDTSEDTDVIADKDNIADVDKVEDADPDIDENTADDMADELYEDADTADQEIEDNDDESAIRSKDSGCGCSVL